MSSEQHNSKIYETGAMIKRHKVLIWHILSFCKYRHAARPLLRQLDRSMLAQDWCSPDSFELSKL